MSMPYFADAFQHKAFTASGTLRSNKKTPAKPGFCCSYKSTWSLSTLLAALMPAALERLHGLDHGNHDLLRVAVDEVAVVGIEQLVLAARIALALAALDHVNLLGLVAVENR